MAVFKAFKPWMDLYRYIFAHIQGKQVLPVQHILKGTVQRALRLGAKSGINQQQILTTPWIFFTFFTKQ